MSVLGGRSVLGACEEAAKGGKNWLEPNVNSGSVEGDDGIVFTGLCWGQQGVEEAREFVELFLPFFLSCENASTPPKRLNN